MALYALAMLAGLVVLAISGDQFVTGAARISSRLGIPSIVVGVIVLGFGTSLPELFTSSLAAAHGSLGLAIGSVVGSNVANATVVTGFAALIAAPRITNRVLRMEAPASVVAVVLLATLIQGELTRTKGAVLLVALAIALVATVRTTRIAPRIAGTDAPQFASEVEVEYLETASAPPATLGSALPTATSGNALEVLRTILGLAATLGGAALLVWGALRLASSSGVNQGVVGTTILGLGTSLPELVSGVAATRHGETDLVLGNVLGSNLFNALCVAGIAALVHPGHVPASVTGIPTIVMLGTMVLLAAALYSGKRLRRLEGAGLLGLYLITVVVTAVLSKL